MSICRCSGGDFGRELFPEGRMEMFSEVTRSIDFSDWGPRLIGLRFLSVVDSKYGFVERIACRRYDLWRTSTSKRLVSA